MKKLRSIYFGTPDFSVPTLEMLSKHPNIELVDVVSMPDRPAGRGHDLKSPEVIEYAKAHDLPFVQTANINQEQQVIERWKSQEIDLMIVLAFAQFLGSNILNIPKLGCFNIHTSLLPKYRGAAPIQYALWNGDVETGVSIQKMVKKMDAGDIVHSLPTKIEKNETGGMLSGRLRLLAAEACQNFLGDLLAGNVRPEPQDERNVSFAPTLKKEDGFLDFSSQTLVQIQNRIRAMDPWPGTFCFINSKRLRVLSADSVTGGPAAGQIKTSQGQLLVGCKDGALRLSKVQLEGKKASTDTDLLNGFRETLALTPMEKATT